MQSDLSEVQFSSLEHIEWIDEWIASIPEIFWDGINYLPDRRKLRLPMEDTLDKSFFIL